MAGLTRRDLFKVGIGGLAAAAAVPSALSVARASDTRPATPPTAGPKAPEFDPVAFLTAFDAGKVSKLPDGRTLREFTLVSRDLEIEIAPGIHYPAIAFNGQVPGPTLRATEGDRVRVHFRNESVLPHTVHFHGFHPANMDGVFEIVEPGREFTYEFDADPFGLHLYHCHVMPLREHIARGLYGTFIIDPPASRPAMTEMVMVMNGYDTDFDGENNFYTVNGVVNVYRDRPIKVKVGEKLRVYLVNITEFDLLNSMHTHATFFHYYPTGTSLTPSTFTDTVMLCQGERGILEFSYRYPGKYMFHAHQSEFAELGWNGLFEVSS